MRDSEQRRPQLRRLGDQLGHRSEITTEAEGAVIMDTSLKRVDELFHIARRMRRIALQSAVGGMALTCSRQDQRQLCSSWRWRSWMRRA